MPTVPNPLYEVLGGRLDASVKSTEGVATMCGKGAAAKVARARSITGVTQEMVSNMCVWKLTNHTHRNELLVNKFPAKVAKGFRTYEWFNNFKVASATDKAFQLPRRVFC